MSDADTRYQDLLHQVMTLGGHRETRSGPVRSLFGRRMVFDLQHEFPLLTLKRLHTRSIVGELAWMLRGRTDVRWLNERGITIWDEWAQDGDLGPVYGKQWRSWQGVGHTHDQITTVLDGLREDPNSRRHIVSAWNVDDLDDMALPPCHVLFQFYVREGKFLDCQLYQRSADIFLGLPFNIASYALLTSLVAWTVGLAPGRLHHVLGDVHLYENHVVQAVELLGREGKDAPSVLMQSGWDLLTLDVPDVMFEGYDPHPPIFAEVAV